MSRPFAHYVARAERCVFADDELARRAWRLLQTSFPAALAATLMPDHLHLVAPDRGAAGARQLGRILRRVTRPLGRDAARWWAPVPEPEALRSRDKLMRTVRYVWLNPCRPWRHVGRTFRLVDDPLKWLWSTLRDTLGFTVTPWVSSDALTRAFGWRRDDRRPHLVHAYATNDDHVAESARHFPGDVVASATTQALQDILDAVLAATRAPVAALRRKSTARRIAVGLAYRYGWDRPTLLGEHLGLHPNSVSRIAQRMRQSMPTAQLDVAAKCLDPRLRRVLDVSDLHRLG